MPFVVADHAGRRTDHRDRRHHRPARSLLLTGTASDDKTELGLVDAADPAPLVDTGELGQEHLRHDDRVAGAREATRRAAGPSPLDGSNVARTLPALERWIGERRAFVEPRSVCTPSTRSTYTTSAPAGTPSWTVSPRALRNSTSSGRPSVAHGGARRRQIAQLDEAQPGTW